MSTFLEILTENFRDTKLQANVANLDDSITPDLLVPRKSSPHLTDFSGLSLGKQKEPLKNHRNSCHRS